MKPLKTHPRDTPHNRARMERAGRLWSDVLGHEREALSMLIDAFERALASQDPARIREAGEDLDSFLQPYFPHDE
jgi:molecular chaperone HscC